MSDKSWNWTIVILFLVLLFSLGSLVGKAKGKTEAEIVSLFENGKPFADFERQVGKPIHFVKRTGNDRYYYLSVDGSVICVQVNNKTGALSTHYTTVRYFFLVL